MKQFLDSAANQNHPLRELFEFLKKEDAFEKAKFYRDKVVSKMKELRTFADELEKLVDKKSWPFPTYEDLLFKL